MLGEISAVVGSLKALSDIGSGLLAARTMEEVRARTVELQGKLLDIQSVVLEMQQAMAQMQDANIKLQRENDALKARTADLDRYELTTFPRTGAHAYQLKEDARASEPRHYVCATCYKKGEISILQPNGRILMCSSCKTQITTEPPPTLRRNTSNRGFTRDW